MTALDAPVTTKQKVRAAMKKHGLIEITDNLYSAGDFRGKDLKVVAVKLPKDPTDEQIELAAEEAAKTYRSST